MTKQDIIQNNFSSQNEEYLKINKRGYCDIAMRVGKCRIALQTIRKLKCKRILVLYPDLKIKDSWTTDLAKLGLSEDNYTFSHYMSIKKCIGKYDIVILDEFPEMSLAQLNNVKELIDRLNCYVLGLSGTVSDKSKQLANNELGMYMINQYTAEEAINDGLISNYQVTIHTIPLNNTKKYLKNSAGNSITEATKYANFNFVIESNRRKGIPNKFTYLNRARLVKNSISKDLALKDLLSKLEGRVLVFVGSIKAAEKLKIPVFHSQTKDLKEFDNFISGKTKQLAVIEIGGSGVTYKNLSHLVMANVTWNEETASQRIFRCMMLDYEDKVADIHIVISTEDSDINKCKQALSMLDQNKIKWL